MNALDKNGVREIIKVLSGAKEREHIAIVPPCMGDKNKLRVYAYGGEIGRIATTHKSKCTALSEAYIKYLENDKEQTKLKTIIDSYEKDTLLKTPQYIELAVRAAKIRYGEKERRIENDILKRYMCPQNSRNWCAVDMEFFPSAELKIGKGKPDIIVLDFQLNQLGMIELKYKNESMQNMNKHFSDFMGVCNDTEKSKHFNREIRRRIGFLQEYILPEPNARIKHYLDSTEEKSPVWFGFLFVGGKKKGAQAKVGEMWEELSEEAGWDKCRFRYVNAVDELAEHGLCFGDMETVEQFLQRK